MNVNGVELKRWQKWVLGLIVVMLLLFGFVGLLLPGIVRNKAIKEIEAATGRKTEIARLAINPFSWKVQIDGFRLREKGSDAVFASFSSVRVNLSSRSLFRFAPIVTDVRVVSPYVHLVRTAANTYNFSDLMDGQGSHKEKSGKRARFSLNNIVIENGGLDFVDRVLTQEKSHEIRQIALSIPSVSSISYQADKYVLPNFSAVVNGAPLRIKGEMKPFDQSMESSFNINLHNLDLPFYFAYVPGSLPVKIDSGRLSVNIEVSYRIVREGEPEVTVSGDLDLIDFVLRDRIGDPLVALKRGEVRIDRMAVMSRDLVLSFVALEGLEVYLTRDQKGVWSYSQFIPEEKQPEPAKKTLVRIAETHLQDGQVYLSDAIPGGGFKALLSEITFDMSGFSTAEGEKADYTLSFNTGRDENARITGDFSLLPLTTATSVELNRIKLEAYYPYLAAFITAPVKGRLDATAGLRFTSADGFRVEKAELRGSELFAPFGTGDGINLPLVELKGGSVDLKGMTAEVEAVVIKGGDVSFSRDNAGILSPLNLLWQKEKDQLPKPKRLVENESSPQFRYLVKAIDGSGIAISFTDGMQDEEPEFKMDKLSFSFANLTGPKVSPIPFRLSADYGKGGMKASGVITPAPFKAKGECSLWRIPLTDFTAYLPEGMNVFLADGYLNARTSFRLVQAEEEVSGDFSGELGVRSFYCLDAVNFEDLLKWDSLQLDGMSGALDPFAIDIKEISLSKFFIKVVVNKDGTLNLQQLYTPKDKEGGSAQNQQPNVSPPAGNATRTTPNRVRIEAVTLQDGILSFTDHHMSLEYDTTMYNLGGRISGLSSDEGGVANVDLRGNLENHSPLRISGQINPLRNDLFLDLKMSFSDIELSPITPYSGTFLGYSVDKGKLSLDLKYRIENKKLESENKVFLDQFTFGKKVKSDKATKLPVRLAVALLKDKNGEIHIDLPVIGRIDDPKFSVFGVAIKMLKNLLVKAATAPFSLLQGALGGKEGFSDVPFVFGSARLADDERDKLRKFGQAFQNRPALKLEVSGFVDRERDAEGYRHELLLKKMKSEKFLLMVKQKKELGGESLDSVTIQPDEESRYLKAAYRKEKFPKPRNVFGLVKDLPDAEMKKLILSNIVVGEEQLQFLAHERVVEVRNLLVSDGKLSPERIFEKKGDIFRLPEKEGEAGSRVELGVVIP